MACAASGKSGGFLALDWCDGSPLGPLARASFALHADLARDLGTDYGYRRMETFMLAARERGGRPAEHRVPAPAWLDGDGTVLDALGSVETTAQVDPARFTAALIAAARGPRRDAQARASWRACSAAGARPAGSPSTVTPLEADAVVLAMGPWTGAIDLPLPRVRGLKGYSVTLAAAGVARARAVRRLPHGRRPPARAGDLPPARRGGLRVRDGGSRAAAGLAGRGRRQRGGVRHPRARRRPRVHPARRGADHPPSGLLPARDGRRPAADRRRAGGGGRLRGDGPRPLGHARTLPRPAGPSPS